MLSPIEFVKTLIILYTSQMSEESAAPVTTEDQNDSSAKETELVAKESPPKREGAGRDRKAVVRLEVEGAKEKTDLEIFEVSLTDSAHESIAFFCRPALFISVPIDRLAAIGDSTYVSFKKSKQGPGTALRDIGAVEEKLRKLNAKGDELKLLHRVIWGRPGQVIVPWRK